MDMFVNDINYNSTSCNLTIEGNVSESFLFFVLFLKRKKEEAERRMTVSVLKEDPNT